MVELKTLAEGVIAQARQIHLTLATAESCTAGALSMLLADVPGSGDCLHGGFVVYTKENKSAALGVSATLIAVHTAVSREVAEAMAKGVLDHCPADVAVAITGVAGPMPDEDGNKVGDMHVAVATRRGDLRHRYCSFGPSDRDDLRKRTMLAALSLTAEAITRIEISTSTSPSPQDKTFPL